MGGGGGGGGGCILFGLACYGPRRGKRSSFANTMMKYQRQVPWVRRYLRKADTVDWHAVFPEDNLATEISSSPARSFHHQYLRSRTITTYDTYHSSFLDTPAKQIVCTPYSPRSPANTAPDASATVGISFRSQILAAGARTHALQNPCCPVNGPVHGERACRTSSLPMPLYSSSPCFLLQQVTREIKKCLPTYLPTFACRSLQVTG